MPLRLPALSCSKPSSACLPDPCGEQFSGDPRKLSGDALVYVPLPGFLTRLCAQTASRLSLAPAGSSSLVRLRRAVLWRPTKTERDALVFVPLPGKVK